MIKIRGLVDEDFVNYKKPAMFIAFPYCTFKCDKECGYSVCQNSSLVENTNIINIGTPLAIDFKDYLDSNNLNSTQKEIGKVQYVVSGDENKFLESKKVFRELNRKTFSVFIL